jgi:hypothetical protein
MHVTGGRTSISLMPPKLMRNYTVEDGKKFWRSRWLKIPLSQVTRICPQAKRDQLPQNFIIILKFPDPVMKTIICHNF